MRDCIISIIFCIKLEIYLNKMTKLVLKEYPLMSHDDIPVFLLMKATMVCWCSPISRKQEGESK